MICRRGWRHNEYLYFINSRRNWIAPVAAVKTMKRNSGSVVSFTDISSRIVNGWMKYMIWCICWWSEKHLYRKYNRSWLAAGLLLVLMWEPNWMACAQVTSYCRKDFMRILICKELFCITLTRRYLLSAWVVLARRPNASLKS